MVNIYVMENEKLDLSINVTKSRCFRVGRKFKSKVENIKVNDVVINWVENLRYLGICIKSGRTFKIDLHNNRASFVELQTVN